MASAPIINSFRLVDISPLKTLILCDIDETLICHPNCVAIAKEKAIEIFGEDADEEMEDGSLLNLVRQMNTHHTDADGFTDMLAKLKHLDGSELMFLTARKKVTEKYTERQFTTIGLNYVDFTVHYTEAEISKGEYIRNNLDLTQWQDIVFIDDYASYLQSVKDLFPHVRCFQFDHGHPK
jgi:hypothetical protein